MIDLFKWEQDVLVEARQRIYEQRTKMKVDRKSEILVNAKCFGNFDVFADARPIHFISRKSKELLAYLVHKKGNSSTTQELIAVLFEGRAHSYSVGRQFQALISSLIKSLRDVGVERIIVKQFNSLAVDITKIDCDYYNFLDGESDAISQYVGEYMLGYNWAEFMAKYLDFKLFSDRHS